MSGIDKLKHHGRLYVLPLLPKFKTRYPNIDVDISFNDQYVDMVNEGFDLSIRSGTLDDSNLIAKQLSPMDYVTCVSPAYAAQHQTLIDQEEWQRLTWIKFRFKQSGKECPLYPPSLDNERSQHPLITPRHVLVDDGEAMMELCAGGMGITQTPHFIARNWLNDKSVIAIGNGFREYSQGVYAYYPSRNQPERTQVFIDFLQQCLADINEGPNHTWALDLANHP